MTIQPSLSLSDIPGSSTQLNSLLPQIFKTLCNIESEEDTLQAGVEIIHQALKCDRAVVYSLQSDSYCKIVAEAVTPGYTQILDTTIKDSCFESGYLDKYQKGRVRAITDIYNSGMKPCHIENLEKIEVKSNLVVPLIRPDKSLSGLLVTHQCSSTRQWQQPEIELVLRVADWMMVQLSQHKAYLDLKNQLENNEKAQQLIVSITQEVHSAATSNEVLQIGVNKAQQVLNCDRVVVYGLQDRSMGKIVAEATVPVLASILGSEIKDPCFEYRYIDKYQQGRIRATANIFEAGMSPCYVENLSKIGVKSNLVAPIIWDDGKIYGLLVAHQCFNFKDWQPEEIEYFKKIAFHTGLSLSSANAKDLSRTVETGLDRLDMVKGSVTFAKFKTQQIKQPLQNFSQILVEANNLNKLLEREINSINQTSSLQTKKDIKLIQIITAKLIVTTTKLIRSLGTVNISRNELDAVLDEAIAHIDNGTTGN